MRATRRLEWRSALVLPDSLELIASLVRIECLLDISDTIQRLATSAPPIHASTGAHVQEIRQSTRAIAHLRTGEHSVRVSSPFSSRTSLGHFSHWRSVLWRLLPEWRQMHQCSWCENCLFALDTNYISGHSRGVQLHGELAGSFLRAGESTTCVEDEQRNNEYFIVGVCSSCTGTCWKPSTSINNTAMFTAHTDNPMSISKCKTIMMGIPNAEFFSMFYDYSIENSSMSFSRRRFTLLYGRWAEVDCLIDRCSLHHSLPRYFYKLARYTLHFFYRRRLRSVWWQWECPSLLVPVCRWDSIH